MSIYLFLFLVLLSAVGFATYISWVQEEKEATWRHEFILLVQAKKPLWVTTAFIEQLAVFYVDSGQWETTPPAKAAKIELDKMARAY